MAAKGRTVTVAAAGVALILLLAQFVGLLSRDAAADVAVGVVGVSLVASLLWQRRNRSPSDSTSDAPDWLDVSDEVAEYIQRHGNVLYVWGKDIGGGFAVLRGSLDRPVDVEFDEILRDPFRLRIALGLTRPPELRIRYRRWPAEQGGEQCHRDDRVPHPSRDPPHGSPSRPP